MLVLQEDEICFTSIDAIFKTKFLWHCPFKSCIIFQNLVWSMVIEVKINEYRIFSVLKSPTSLPSASTDNNIFRYSLVPKILYLLTNVSRNKIRRFAKIFVIFFANIWLYLYSAKCRESISCFAKFFYSWSLPFLPCTTVGTIKI